MEPEVHDRWILIVRVSCHAAFLPLGKRLSRETLGFRDFRDFRKYDRGSPTFVESLESQNPGVFLSAQFTMSRNHGVSRKAVTRV
jgi:prephenate dehydrogenase